MDNSSSKTQNGLTKFRRIAIFNQRPSTEKAKMIFLLQFLTDPIFNGRKSKINLVNPKDAESSDFRKKTESPEFISICIPQNKTGRNFNSLKDILELIPKQNAPIALVVLADIDQTNAPGTWLHIFGETAGDKLVGLGEKTERDFLSYQSEFTKIVLARVPRISDCIDSFKANASERGILAQENALRFITIKSEERNNMVRSVAHLTERVDILLHRRDKEGGNFISTSERAAKHMPAILAALNKEENRRNPNSTSLWHCHFSVIYSNHGNKSLIKFAEIAEIIENAVRAHKIAPVTDTEMSAAETVHNSIAAPHHDSAMAEAPAAA